MDALKASLRGAVAFVLVSAATAGCLGEFGGWDGGANLIHLSVENRGTATYPLALAVTRGSEEGPSLLRESATLGPRATVAREVRVGEGEFVVSISVPDKAEASDTVRFPGCPTRTTIHVPVAGPPGFTFGPVKSTCTRAN